MAHKWRSCDEIWNSILLTQEQKTAAEFDRREYAKQHGAANETTADSQRYVHPSQKNLDVSVQRLEALAEKARTAIREEAKNRALLSVSTEKAAHAAGN